MLPVSRETAKMHDSQDEKGIAHFRVKHAIMGIASLRICGNRLPSLAMPWAKKQPFVWRRELPQRSQAQGPAVLPS